jgi:hypothetical protein
MWVCRGQLKTLHTNVGHCDLLFLPEWLQHFASNVDKNGFLLAKLKYCS